MSCPIAGEISPPRFRFDRFLFFPAQKTISSEDSSIFQQTNKKKDSLLLPQQNEQQKQSTIRIWSTTAKECLEKKTSMAETSSDGKKERTNSARCHLLLVPPKKQCFRLIKNARKTRQEAKRSNKCRKRGGKIPRAREEERSRRAHAQADDGERGGVAGDAAPGAVVAAAVPVRQRVGRVPEPRLDRHQRLPVSVPFTSSRRHRHHSRNKQHHRRRRPRCHSRPRIRKNLSQPSLSCPKPPPFRQQPTRAGQQVLATACSASTGASASAAAPCPCPCPCDGHHEGGSEGAGRE